MSGLPQVLFADRLPPLIGGVEMHGGAFIKYFVGHPQYPLKKIVRELDQEIDWGPKPVIFFFNSGRWIEKMEEIRMAYPQAKIVYRTGGNEIIKAPLNEFHSSHEKRQRIWARILNETVDLLLTNSSFTETRLREIGVKVPFAKCVGGVNSSQLGPKSFGSKSFRFFSAARFVPYKNPLLLVDVFHELYSRGETATLEVAGDGPLFEEAEKLGRNNPLITFLGRMENHEIVRRIADADIYIQLSSDFLVEVPGGSYIHTEGMGRSILEAISVGTYVVAGNCGALKEIVTEDRGKLIPLNSPSRIADILQKLITSPHARRDPTDVYNWNHLFRRYETLYESLNHHREKFSVF